MKILETCLKVAQVEARLTKYTYLSRSNLPGHPDGIVFQILNRVKRYPDRRQNPNFYHWYILMRQFAASTISKWIQDYLYYDADDTLIPNFVAQYNNPDQESQLSPPRTHADQHLTPEHNKDQGRQKNNEAEYMIDILLKEYSQQMVQLLLNNLRPYNLEVNVLKEAKQIKIVGMASSGEQQNIANLVSKTIEYDNLQLRGKKKVKTSIQ